MKVDSSRTWVVRVPYEEGHFGTHVLLQLHTDEGLDGLGYVSIIGGWAVKPLRLTLETLAGQVVGQDPLNVEAITSRLLGRGGWGGLLNRAVSAIDVALWDIRGRAAGQPVYKLLGGFRDRVPCYASYRLWWQNDLETIARNGAGFVESGFKAMKYRLGGIGTAEKAAERTRVLREAVGDGIDLMVDVNQGWNLKQTLTIAPELEEFDIYWLEDPISAEDQDGLTTICQSLNLRLCAGENYHSLSPFRQLLERHGLDIVMLDPMLGGLTQWLKAAHLAEAYGLPVVSHLATEVMAHAVAAIPNGLYVEYNPWAEPLFKEVPGREDGMIALSDRPGLGFELDDAAVKRFELE
jgi:L-talarate/galactarate dehydratase